MSINKSLLVVIFISFTLICVQQIDRSTTNCKCENPIVLNKGLNEKDEDAKSQHFATDNRKDVVINTQEIIIEQKTTVSDRNKKTNADSVPKNEKLQNYFLEYWNSILSGKNAIPDDQLADIISKVFTDHPNHPPLPYNFHSSNPSLNGQIGVPPIVDKILGGKKNGFYIETGAYDGETYSNSLLFELKRNYTGLLIEPSKDYLRLIKKNRRATSLNVCLATKNVPHEVEFYNYDMVGGIKGQISGWAKSEVEKKAKVIKVTCLPLYSILMSMGNPIVDFFSLDIEGAEHLVLKTIPWDKVNIRVLAVEVGGNGRGFKEVDEILKQANYTKVLHMVSGQDNIYVRNDFKSSVFGPNQTPKLMDKIPL